MRPEITISRKKLPDIETNFCLAKKRKAIAVKAAIEISLGLISGSSAAERFTKGSAMKRNMRRAVTPLSTLAIRHILRTAYRITVQFTKTFEMLE
jgi:hypothetical protein